MEKLKYAPVVITVYNRPDHTKRLIESLGKCYLSEETEVFIFSDGPKNDTAKQKVEDVRQYLIEIKKKHAFKHIDLSFSENNNGLAKTIIEGVTSIISKYEKVIVLEDDLIVSEDFLQYMNDALDYYENKNQVWSISGYSFPIPEIDNYHYEVYSTTRGCSWGWATWADRWNSVDWKVSDYKSFRYNLLKRKAFAFSGSDLPGMLDAQMFGDINSWAIRWCYQQYKENKLTVYPIKSRVINGGSDNSGTHASATKVFDTILFDKKEKCKFEMVAPDKYIMEVFNEKYYRSLCTRIRSFIKYNIIPKKIVLELLKRKNKK